MSCFESGPNRPANPVSILNRGAQAGLRVMIGSCQSCQSANKVQPRFQNKISTGMRKGFCQPCATILVEIDLNTIGVWVRRLFHYIKFGFDITERIVEHILRISQGQKLCLRVLCCAVPYVSVSPVSERTKPWT